MVAVFASNRSSYELIRKIKLLLPLQFIVEINWLNPVIVNNFISIIEILSPFDEILEMIIIGEAIQIGLKGILLESKDFVLEMID